MRRGEIRWDIGIFSRVAPLLVYLRQKQKIPFVFIWISKLHGRTIGAGSKDEIRLATRKVKNDREKIVQGSFKSQSEFNKWIT